MRVDRVSINELNAVTLLFIVKIGNSDLQIHGRVYTMLLCVWYSPPLQKVLFTT
ncbi:hypothetical protein EWB00_002880, partial [Schistosoma japonicum]